MRVRSKKREAMFRIYRKRVALYLIEHSWCEYPLGCGKRSTSVQHRRGRFGQRLLDETWWAASCADHQMLAEDRTGEALECGWLVRIEGIA